MIRSDKATDQDSPNHTLIALSSFDEKNDQVAILLANARLKITLFLLRPLDEPSPLLLSQNHKKQNQHSLNHTPSTYKRQYIIKQNTTAEYA